MPKPWWVALPLLLAVAVLVVQALRRRAPSRAALNVGVSLLLLAYVGATAALGIYWVANQQLPVFDWHYLFGYATVVLLGVHLAFNLPVVWRVLRRPGAASTKRVAPASVPRRGWLAWAGAALAAAAGYVVGLRHGSTELRVSASAGAADADAALALVDAYHHHSAHSRTAAVRRAAGDWGAAPPAFKRDVRAPRRGLDAPGRPDPATFDARTLGALLWHAAGVSERRGTLHLRCSPSAGALFSTELYVLVRDWPGVTPGAWHHDASSHALERLRDDSTIDFAAAGVDADAADGVAALVVATAVFARSGHKYRDRTYRYVLADLGHVLENLRVAAHALGVDVELQRHFDESRLATAIGVDEAEEGVLALAVLRRPGGPLRTTAAGTGWRVPPLAQAAPGAALPALTAAVHRATSLRRAAPLPAQAQGARQGGDAHDRDRGGETHALPAPDAPALDVLAAIARRRSVRRYRSDALPPRTLSGLLAGCAGAPALMSGALRVDVLALAVASLPAASWRYRAQAHALVRRTPPNAALRGHARAAALGQDVIGDAAAVLVLSIDRRVWAAEPAGAARGWRLAFVEAGLVGERAYLHGGALGLGVCGVGAFYDDEIAALAGVDAPHESVVHLVALGMPA